MATLIEDAYIKTFSGKFNKRFGGALEYRFNVVRKKFFDGEIDVDDEAMVEYQYWYKKPKRELIQFIRENAYGDVMDKVEDGAELIKSVDGWDIYKITNYEASEYYGLGSGWCICGAYPGSYSKGADYFYDYAVCYYFFLNDAADERYCAYAADGRMHVWDGSHGNDVEIEDMDKTTLSDNAYFVFEKVCDMEDMSTDLRAKVPEGSAEQVDMITDYINTCGGVADYISESLLLDYLEYKEILDDIWRDNEIMFRLNLTNEEQFSYLCDYEVEIGEELCERLGIEQRIFDDFDSYEQAVETLGDDFGLWSEEFASVETPESVADYIYNYYGRFDWKAAKAIVDDFDILPEDIAEYIVYERGEGYDLCEEICDEQNW